MLYIRVGLLLVSLVFLSDPNSGEFILSNSLQALMLTFHQSHLSYAVICDHKGYIYSTE